MDVETYRKALYEDIELPSGLRVTVRQLTPIMSLRILTELGLTAEMLTQADSSMIERLATVGFKHMIVTPKVPDELPVEDITRDDFTVLYKKLLQTFGTFTVESPSVEEVKEKQEDFLP